VGAIPDKPFYRLSEVCQFTDTQPYVLRFWESEFPQLVPARSKGGQPLYRREDLDLVLRIKQLLYEEEQTIAAARLRLEDERPDGVSASRTSAALPDVDGTVGPAAARGPRAEAAVAPPADSGMVSRERYDDAVDEIEHLRFQLREAEKRRTKAESALERSEAQLRVERERIQRAIDRLQRIVQLVTQDCRPA
jgi:DNA-binding transcriptional MerR regulator